MSGVRLLNSAGGALFLHSIKKYRGMLNTFFLEEETIQAVAGEREFSNFYVYGGYFYTLFECAVINKAKRII
jgi:hypothetical protein